MMGSGGEIVFCGLSTDLFGTRFENKGMAESIFITVMLNHRLNIFWNVDAFKFLYVYIGIISVFDRKTV